MTLSDISRMQLGQVVDFVITYNERQKKAENNAKREEKRGKRRKATADDIRAFFG